MKNLEYTDEQRRRLFEEVCSRIPYGVKVRYRNSSFTPQYSEYDVDMLINVDSLLHIRLESLDFKLLLRPLSTITKEEVQEFNAINGVKLFYYEDDRIPTSVNSVTALGLDWLLKKGFDWRDSIGFGVAIPKTKRAYCSTKLPKTNDKVKENEKV